MKRKSHGLCLLVALGAVMAGCVTQESRPLPIKIAAKASSPVPAEELLDVSIQLLDPNVPKLEKEQVTKRIDPAVRGAEARYMSARLASTLQDTGYWGQVRVVPEGAAALDVNVSGTIVESDGQHLTLAIAATDSSGKQWLNKTYAGKADTRSYKNGATSKRDPFQNVYAQIADDLAAMRHKLKESELRQLQRLSKLRFESEIAPETYAGYVRKEKNGTYTVARLPAEDSPLERRLEQMREREFALLDTLDDQYQLSAERMAESYVNWRRSNYAELEEEADLKSSARLRMLLGAAAVVGGIVAATDSNASTAGEIAGSVAVAGGIEAFRSGLGQRSEAKVHAESLKQQMESFSAEVAPVNMEVEGKVLELRGNAAQQFTEWRNLLKDLYQNETGVVPATGDAH